MSGIKIPASSTETGNQIQGKTISALSVDSAESANKESVRNQPSAAVKTPADRNVPAKEIFQNTAAALGFPKDALSVSLLMFARFFSLSPSLLGNLRKEFLNSNKTPSSLTSQAPQGKEKALLTEKTFFQASALTAAAAIDKGVSLSPEAHSQYARFLIPPEDQNGQKPENEAFSHTAGEKHKDDEQDEELPNAEKIQAIAEEESKKDSVLDFLNSLPGKDGRHWSVFPFRIKVRGIELSVCIRILKKEALLAEEGSIVIADVSGPKRQWRCFLKEKGESKLSRGEILADFRIYPNVSGRTLERLKKEAERFLSAGFGEITIRNMEKTASWMDDLCNESLPSINKTV